MTISKQSPGGIASAKLQRDAALEAYYLNPNICKFCKSVINVLDNQKVSFVKTKLFCNSSCSATHRNLHYRKARFCKHCNLQFNPLTKKRKVCASCKATRNTTPYVSLSTITKGELFTKRKNYQSARSSIRLMAVKTYKFHNKLLQCKICKYTTFVEICHIKPVNEFPYSATLLEINHIDNLVALCPNHHVEFDSGLLSL